MKNFARAYSKFTPVSIGDYTRFVNSLNQQNIACREIDRVIVNEGIPEFNNLNFPDEIPNRFKVLINGVKFNCLFDDNDDSDCLIVFFSGARTIKDKIPMFKRQSFYPFIPMKVLSIADPMFDKFQELTLGWYYGSKECDYSGLISLLVNLICRKLSIPENKLFFFGSSGGGYVSLRMSAFYNSSTHIAMNPQIDISSYPYAKVFERITGIDLTAKDVYRRNEMIDIICKTRAKVLLTFNYNDRHDCEKHLFPLCNKLGISKLSLGLNALERGKFLWGYNVIGGHNAQGDQFIFTHLMNLAIKVSEEGYCISHSDDELYKNVSSLWRVIEWYIYSYKKLSKK